MREKGLFRHKVADSTVFAKFSRNPADKTKSDWINHSLLDETNCLATF